MRAWRILRGKTMKELALDNLIEEIQGIVATRKFAIGEEWLRMYWELGQAIAQFPAYSRHKSEISQRVADYLHNSARTVGYFVQFYSKYPEEDWSPVLMKIETDGRLPAWRDIVKQELPSGKKVKEETECNHKCPRHCH